jgi:hypothetical protein
LDGIVIFCIFDIQTLKQNEMKELVLKLVKLSERDFNPMETLQLISMNNSMVWFSWGVPTDSIKLVGNKGLLFKVNGHHYKGLVFITLSWMDLYDVHLVNPDGEVTEKMEGIFFDQLQEVIDNRIERISDYKF